MEAEAIIGGVIFAAVVIGFVVYKRSQKSNGGPFTGPGGGKDEPPRTDRPRPRF